MGSHSHGPQGDPLSDTRSAAAAPPPGGARSPAVGGSASAVVARPVDSLVASAIAGDRHAFGDLVEATYRDTYTLALRLTGNEHDARDVTQDAYLRAFRSIDTFRGEAAFTTWLYRVTANCAMSLLSARRRHTHIDLDLVGDQIADLADSMDPADAVVAAGLSAPIDRALVALPMSSRVVVLLRDVYELSHDEIAATLGISSAAARVRLHRGRAQMRAALAAQGDLIEAEEASRAM